MWNRCWTNFGPLSPSFFLIRVEVIFIGNHASSAFNYRRGLFFAARWPNHCCQESPTLFHVLGWIKRLRKPLKGRLQCTNSITGWGRAARDRFRIWHHSRSVHISISTYLDRGLIIFASCYNICEWRIMKTFSETCLEVCPHFGIGRVHFISLLAKCKSAAKSGIRKLGRVL